jgi:plasmid maintenance system killer protein
MQKEKLHKRIAALERQLDQKQELELEVQQLKSQLSVMRLVELDSGSEIVNKVETFLRDLSETEGELAHLNQFNQDLVVQERKSNDELQEARRALISVRIFKQFSLNFRLIEELGDSLHVLSDKLEYN